MPRTSNKIAAERRHAILAATRAGREPVKAIAAELGLSLQYVRTVIWAAGYRCMQVSPEERAHLLTRRGGRALAAQIVASRSTAARAA